MSYQLILVALPKRLDIQIEDFQFRDSWTIRVWGRPFYFWGLLSSKINREVHRSLLVDEDPDIMIQQRTISKVRVSDFFLISKLLICWNSVQSKTLQGTWEYASSSTCSYSHISKWSIMCPPWSKWGPPYPNCSTTNSNSTFFNIEDQCQTDFSSNNNEKSRKSSREKITARIAPFSCTVCSKYKLQVSFNQIEVQRSPDGNR